MELNNSILESVSKVIDGLMNCEDWEEGINLLLTLEGEGCDALLEVQDDSSKYLPTLELVYAIKLTVHSAYLRTQIEHFNSSSWPAWYSFRKTFIEQIYYLLPGEEEIEKEM